jgi:hypothetical protein
MSQNNNDFSSLKVKRKPKFKNALKQIAEENQNDDIFSQEYKHDSLITYTIFPSIHSNNNVFKKWNGNKSYSIILPTISSLKLN